MFLDVATIILTIFISVVLLVILIGLYYFSKQKYNNFFVSFLLDKDKLNLLKSNKISQQKYKKIKFILNTQTIILIVLAITIIYILKWNNLGLKYIIIILILALKYISNKLIKKTFNE